MTSTGTFQGFSDEKKKSSKVLKPPGGGSSDIFGAGPDETSPRRVKNHNQSQLGSALFGDTPNNSNSNETPRNKPDGNPVTGTGYAESQNNGPAVQNGTSSSNSSEKSNDTSPAAKVPARTRVPPGGYSSGLW
ncbi:hypothetical protein QLX08_002353 [Tetragonisca angustula]|uniref:Microtubule-associated protein Jupiter n=1 Tax=Tetragonisca angustula TaxID=166442 RepID=A0AAW1AE68_9HYME